MAALSEDRLIGWLVFIRLNFLNGRPVDVPGAVTDAMIERGWMRRESDPDWDGDWEACLTDLGTSITDLNGPDWGVDTVPQETT